MIKYFFISTILFFSTFYYISNRWIHFLYNLPNNKFQNYICIIYMLLISTIIISCIMLIISTMSRSISPNFINYIADILISKISMLSALFNNSSFFNLKIKFLYATFHFLVIFYRHQINKAQNQYNIVACWIYVLFISENLKILF